jgi:hypothetical protein
LKSKPHQPISMQFEVHAPRAINLVRRGSANTPSNAWRNKVSLIKGQNHVSPSWWFAEPRFDEVRRASFVQLRAGLISHAILI